MDPNPLKRSAEPEPDLAPTPSEPLAKRRGRSTSPPMLTDKIQDILQKIEYCDEDEKYGHMVVLLMRVVRSNLSLDQRYIKQKEAQEMLLEKGDVYRLIEHLISAPEEEKRFILGEIYDCIQGKIHAFPLQDLTRASTIQAIEMAWKGAYQLAYHAMLLVNLRRMHLSNWGKPYGNFVSFVQGSGTGKSRMVDEMANLVFTLPLNLRSKGESNLLAYPHPDDDIVREYLTEEKSWYEKQRAHCFAFFYELFTETLNEFTSLELGNAEPEEKAKAWRAHLHRNGVRRRLYTAVVKNAKVFPSISRGKQSLILTQILREEWEPEIRTQGMKERFDEVEATSQVCGVLERLLTAIEGERWRESLTAVPPKPESFVRIILYIDEAHELTTKKAPQEKGGTQGDGKTLYDTLVSVITNFSLFPIFFVFLSTTSRVQSLAPPPYPHPSARAVIAAPHLNAPITETPFDCAPNMRVIPRTLSLHHVRDVKFLANFGRPLFWSILIDSDAQRAQVLIPLVIPLARSKLTATPELDKNIQPSPNAQLAVVDVRLCLSYESGRQATYSILSDLVASHMRTAYSIPQHQEYMRSGYPSEPILAEAAALEMDHWKSLDTVLNIFSVLNTHMNNDLIDRGEREEIIARAILTEDRAVFSSGCRVETFIRHLFQQQHAEAILISKPDNVADGSTFSEKFQQAVIRFTHFVRLGDGAGASSSGMFAAFTRCMAFAARPGQASFDFVLPVLLNKDSMLEEAVMTAILIRVKRRGSKGGLGDDDFTAEQIQFFPEDGPIRPYVTLIMELGVHPETLPVPKTTKTKTNKRTKNGHVGDAPNRRSERTKPGAVVLHERYNIWAYGCSSAVYRVIDDYDEDSAKLVRLLAGRHFFAEHARTDKQSIAAVRRLKPEWVQGEDCYDWVADELLLGGETVEETEVPEGVIVWRYKLEGDGDGEVEVDAMIGVEM
ncbi:hypothetical protein AX16_006189 [Volvariella volvacea WC 439]|nr:hypothetical protein AX16_006189 [Volvariella volvacea WC 439]